MLGHYAYYYECSVCKDLMFENNLDLLSLCQCSAMKWSEPVTLVAERGSSWGRGEYGRIDGMYISVLKSFAQGTMFMSGSRGSKIVARPTTVTQWHKHWSSQRGAPDAPHHCMLQPGEVLTSSTHTWPKEGAGARHAKFRGSNPWPVAATSISSWPACQS